jgi:hypothetical protein
MRFPLHFILTATTLAILACAPHPAFAGGSGSRPGRRHLGSRLWRSTGTVASTTIVGAIGGAATAASACAITVVGVLVADKCAAVGGALGGLAGLAEGVKVVIDSHFLRDLYPASEAPARAVGTGQSSPAAAYAVSSRVGSSRRDAATAAAPTSIRRAAGGV